MKNENEHKRTTASMQSVKSNKKQKDQQKETINQYEEKGHRSVKHINKRQKKDDTKADPIPHKHR